MTHTKAVLRSVTKETVFPAVWAEKRGFWVSDSGNAQKFQTAARLTAATVNNQLHNSANLNMPKFHGQNGGGNCTLYMCKYKLVRGEQCRGILEKALSQIRM